MSKQAHDLVLSERQAYEKSLEELHKKIQMYEIEIAKKYAILKWLLFLKKYYFLFKNMKRENMKISYDKYSIYKQT